MVKSLCGLCARREGLIVLSALPSAYCTVSSLSLSLSVWPEASLRSPFPTGLGVCSVQLCPCVWLLLPRQGNEWPWAHSIHVLCCPVLS